MKTRPDSAIEHAKSFIRHPYAWPGGYPRILIMSDGECICPDCARQNFRALVQSSNWNSRDGWRPAGVDINWEDDALRCAHCGAQIESAYGGQS